MRALGTYKSPLTFDGLFDLVKMFETDLNNAQELIHSQLYTPTATVCNAGTPVVAVSLIVSTVDHLVLCIQSLLLFWQYIFAL